MLLILFSFLGMMSSFVVFTCAMHIHSIDRIVLSTPKSIFESSVPLVSDEENFVPYFNKTMLEEKLTSYYESNIHEFIKTLAIEFYYFNPLDESICVEENCQGVKVTVTIDFPFNLNYEKTLSYQIQGGQL